MASLASPEVQALRFALRFSPPTLVLEYTRGDDARKRVSKFQLRKLKRSSVSLRAVLCVVLF